MVGVKLIFGLLLAGLMLQPARTALRPCKPFAHLLRSSGRSSEKLSRTKPYLDTAVEEVVQLIREHYLWGSVPDSLTRPDKVLYATRHYNSNHGMN